MRRSDTLARRQRFLEAGRAISPYNQAALTTPGLLSQTERLADLPAG